jgi:hypothetical protein
MQVNEGIILVIYMTREAEEFQINSPPELQVE